jgi:hypothetical protein
VFHRTFANEASNGEAQSKEQRKAAEHDKRLKGVRRPDAKVLWQRGAEQNCFVHQSRHTQPGTSTALTAFPQRYADTICR